MDTMHERINGQYCSEDCCRKYIVMFCIYRMAPGTVIQSERELSNVLLSSIVLKRGVTMVDIVSTKMVGQYGKQDLDYCTRSKISTCTMLPYNYLELRLKKLFIYDRCPVGFLAKVFDVFREFKISVDVVATSEVSVSFTLDIQNLWTLEAVDQKLQVSEKHCFLLARRPF